MGNTPNVRFKGFTEDWEQRKLEEVCSEIGDGLHSAPEYDDSGKFFFINGNNLINGHIVINSNETKRVSENTFEKNNKQLDDNTVLLSINGTIGNLAYYQGEPVMLGKSAAYLKANKIDKTFLYSLLQTTAVMNNFMLSLTGTTIKNLGLDAIKKTKISIPELREQERIGLYFSQLDHLITLHQQRCDEIKELKKYMLQNMFPQKDEKVPKIRFDGFTGDWEQRKLGELASSFEYGLNAAAKEYDGENKYIRITDIDDNTHEFLTDNLTSPDIELTGADNYKLTEGDILFARTGASVGKSYIYKNSDGLVYYAGFLIRARIKEEYDTEFVFQNTLTDRYNKYIAVTSQRSGQPGVNAQEYAEFEIKVPKKEEQTKIGTYFRNIDNLITLHQQKCAALKEFKKYTLQNMFPQKGENKCQN